MTTHTSRIALALAVVALAGCGADRSAATRRGAVLSDARSDGAPGFYFLPPVAPEPASSTVDDAGLSHKQAVVARALRAGLAGEEPSQHRAPLVVLAAEERKLPAATRVAAPGRRTRHRVAVGRRPIGSRAARRGDAPRATRLRR